MVLEQIVLAENVIDVANRLTVDLTGVLRNVALLAAIAVVIFTYFKTRAWVPTLVAIVMAGVVLWAVNNAAFLRDSTKRTIEQSQADVRMLTAADAPRRWVQPAAVRHVAGTPDRGL
jgi:hypothetical protein